MTIDNKPGLLYFISLGCAKNLVDSEQIMGDLVQQGYQLTSLPEQSSVAIINTCAFLGEARQEALDTINEVARVKKKKNKLQKIVVVGCLAQYFSGNKLKEKVPEIDLVIPLNQYHKIPELLKYDFASTADLNNSFHEVTSKKAGPRLLSSSPHSVYVKIAEGCDNRCAYCLIPALRGGLQSRDMEEIISEVKGLQKLGAKEINLIAQDTTSYGKDLYGKPMIVPLLEKLSTLRGIKWLRLLYAHPAHISHDLIQLISNKPNICNYIDMPIQHINNKILRLMGRKTTREEIVSIYQKIREGIPGAVLRTTVMVGYPGESLEEFNELLSFLRKYPFERVGAFIYSPEEGTKGFELTPRVKKETAQARLKKVMLQQKKVSKDFNRSLLGERCNVLVDNFFAERKVSHGRLFSHAPEVDGKVVITRSRKLKAGDMVKVKIIGIGTYDLLGEETGNEFS